MSHDLLSHDFYCPKEETSTYVWNCWNDPQCCTVKKLLKLWTPEKIAVITLKFEQTGFTVE